MDWNYIFSEAIGNWFIAGILYFFYYAGECTAKMSRKDKDLPATRKERLKGYAHGILIAGIIAIFGLPLSLRSAGTAFVTVIAPILLGIYTAYEKDKGLSSQEREEQNRELNKIAREAEENGVEW